MKNIVSVLLTFWCTVGFAQNPEIKSEMPNLIPPSPTVAALMKFQEVPVSNYTGVPNISIPLYSTSTRSKNINFDVSLSYHSGSAGYDERASDVGLGWSLIAGGTISRTVRNIPDEYYDTQGIVASGKGKIGIYNDNTLYKNKYQQVLDLYDSGVDPTNNPIMSEFYWNTTERNLYDTEYDLWQFNFMGHSGKFIIKKNKTNNTLEVSNIDKSSNLKIVNFYNSSSYVPTSFEIYDDLGYRYVFNVPEITKINTVTTTEHHGLTGIDSNVTPNITFTSAFHLSEIFDTNGKRLVKIEYNNESNRNIEYTVDSSITTNVMYPLFYMNIDYLKTHGFPVSQIKNIDPKNSSTITNKRVTTKKLKRANIEGMCKIDFNYAKGRSDSNYLVGIDSSYVFKGITVKRWDDSTSVKKVDLEHVYSTLKDTRLMLSAVKTKNFINAKNETYSLEYRQNEIIATTPIKKDLWGNFKIANFFGDTSREVNPDFCTSDILQKMTLPTGGCIIYSFESNTYSYVRNIAVANFDENPKNWDYHNATVTFLGADKLPGMYITTNKKAFFTIAEPQDVILKGIVNTTQGVYLQNYFFYVYKHNETTPIVQQGVICVDCIEDDSVIIKDLPAGDYDVKFTSLNGALTSIFTDASITVNYKTRNSNYYKFLYGGGSRISKIGYFKNDVPKVFYQYGSSQLPDKEKRYNYQFLDNTEKSSGSLVLAKPMYEYDFNSSYYFFMKASDLPGCPDSAGIQEFMFTKQTDYNNIKAIKTGGGDIGYQNVSVEEVNNGKIQYTYSCPIDVPEPMDNFIDTKPFLPCYNLDYKRGLIKSEVTLNSSNKKLTETNYQYEFEEVNPEDTVFGVSTYIAGDNFPFSWMYSNYVFYINSYNLMHYVNGSGCASSESEQCPFDILCSLRDYIVPPGQYILFQKLYTANGWAKLSSKTTKNYFYPTISSPADMVQINETYIYNPTNKRISESTATNSQGEVLKTKYFYHAGNSTFSQNRISEIERIETYRDAELLTTNKIEYSNAFAGNASYLPAFIKTSKGSGALESRVRFNKYDEYGHPIEVQQENGMLTSYICGYNKSQPVAKIDNLAYASIPGTTISDIQTKTNIPNNEANVLTALNALRTSFPTASITTYTYIPSVGVTTITDPKGDKISYTYDEFLRLKEVRDKDNKILSENQYNYKTQN